ncbi:pep-cterm sorting domain-containing protein [Anaeramoeba ignava]|uniref:Pep-cterm sorting domain-containing protein n=1 Tax=Anaeramoeba ignava TaxID=1746090 RepID=A0A9Q0RCM8_ANAIG|nr:pep-cterm sorting domain-containing protein [Anaeramoeba ignava]
MDNNNNNNQIQNANQNENQNENENEMKNLEKKVTKNLIKDYSNLLNGNSFKDFSIFVENKSNPFEIKVHKSILSSRSPFFNESLRQESLSISLNQFNKKEMESILSYIYYGNISFENQENLLQLLEISIYFKLNLLKEIIQKKILNSINYSNFFQFLFQNRNLNSNSNEIEIKCFELINQNFSQIKNNENLFNLTKEEIIKFIQFKQEKKEIFQFDFFQFLNNWIEKRNQRLKGKKEKEKEKEKGIEKKRLFHSFFSLFDKDSISKQDFDKLKQFDIFPKSFLVDIQNKVIQDNQKEIEDKEKEIENKEKWKKEVENKEKEIENKNKEIEDKNKEIEDKNKEIEDKWKKEVEKNQKENQQMKIEIEEKWKKEIEDKNKEIEDKNKEIEEKWKKEVEEKDKENKDMKQVFDRYQEKYQKYLEFEKKLEPIKKNFPQFSETRIITEEEYVKKLQEWINDNDFFSKMKKGFSAKRDGFNSQNWHKAVDGKGKTLVIIKTKQNFIFGGFTQVGFKSNYSGEINDSSAFIFSLRNDKGDRIPEKFTYKQGRAIFSRSDVGPLFGDGYDFCLSSNLQPGYSQFGYSYNLPNGIKEGTNEAYSYLAGSYSSWVVDEVESYFI